MGVNLFWNHWEYERGMEELVQALALDPNDARSRAFYGHMLMILGQPQRALEEEERALQLDPLDPFVTGLYGAVLAFTAPPEEAIRVLEAMFDENPGAGFGHGPLAQAYRRAGRMEEETRMLRTQYNLRGDDAVAMAMDRGMEEGGSREALRRAAEVLAHRFDQAYVPAIAIAGFYREAGDVERALDWLERSLEQHDQNLPYMSFWGWDQLYDDPRFQAVIGEVGMPLVGG